MMMMMMMLMMMLMMMMRTGKVDDFYQEDAEFEQFEPFEVVCFYF